MFCHGNLDYLQSESNFLKALSALPYLHLRNSVRAVFSPVTPLKALTGGVINNVLLETSTSQHL